LNYPGNVKPRSKNKIFAKFSFKTSAWRANVACFREVIARTAVVVSGMILDRSGALKPSPSSREAVKISPTHPEGARCCARIEGRIRTTRWQAPQDEVGNPSTAAVSKERACSAKLDAGLAIRADTTLTCAE
jgi:hypothetical protein